MSSFLPVFFYSFIAGLSTIVGVLLVRWAQNWTKRNSLYLISFAVGVLLAVAFFNLIPESTELYNQWYYPALAAILFFFILEQYITYHSCHEEECPVQPVAITSGLGIGLHSLIDGMVIAVGFEVSPTLGIITAMAVIFHELAEGVFSYTLFIHGGLSIRKSVFYSFLIALATPFGAVITFFLLKNISSGILGILLAFAAGSFIYIGAADLIPQTHKKSNLWNLLLVLLGVGFIFVLSRFLG